LQRFANGTVTTMAVTAMVQYSEHCGNFTSALQMTFVTAMTSVLKWTIREVDHVRAVEIMIKVLGVQEARLAPVISNANCS